MSSLYYQHQQHEQQQQIQIQQHDQQRRREQEQHYQFQQQQQQELNYLQSHSYSDNYHHEDRYSLSHSYQFRNEHDQPSTSPSHPPNSDDRFSGENESQDSKLAKQEGQQAREEALDSLHAMMSQEQQGYCLDSYFPSGVAPTGKHKLRQQNIIHGGWREKICQWSYNVVDHFDLPREIVSISLNYFDRYMATLSTPESESNKNGRSGRASPQSSGDLALLASLGTLHLATKVHATNHNDYDPALGPLEDQHHKVPSLSTLANLSRGQFGPASILEMEKILLGALHWRLHPPTLYAFVTFLLKLIPTTKEDPRFGLKPTIASELFEVAMYVAELSVCDAYFVERQIPSSTIALAAICTAMDDLLAPEDSSMAGLVLRGESSHLSGSGCFTANHRAIFLATCAQHLNLGRSQSMFGPTLERLRSMYLGASGLENASKNNANSNNSNEPKAREEANPSGDPQQQRPRTNSYNPPTSPSSIADMSLSTINSTIHSMADTTINGGGSVSLKRGESMVSSIACTSRETDDDYELYGGTAASASNDDQYSSTSNNFRYSPSPPRDDEPNEQHRFYGGGDENRNTVHGLRTTNQSQQPQHAMSCSPIVALH